MPSCQTGGVVTEASTAEGCSTTIPKIPDIYSGSQAQPGHPVCAKAYCLLLLGDLY